MADAAPSLTHPGGYLRQHRVRLAIWIAVAEGILVLTGILPNVAVYVLAIVALLFYVAVARNYQSTTAREAAWIFAASQVLTVLVPIVWHVTKLVAEVAVIVLAVAGLVFLFTEHNRRDRT